MGQPEDLDSQPPDDRAQDQDDHRMPTWVKVFLAASLIAVVLVVVLLALAGGDHGPGRHLPGGEAEIETPAGHTPPFDHG
ncbi:MAG: hypothetical protein KY469_12555 [Actinobacteria bacterium]|nr:hypothetical protein [Actinomycetota bacterium]